MVYFREKGPLCKKNAESGGGKAGCRGFRITIRFKEGMMYTLKKLGPDDREQIKNADEISGFSTAPRLVMLYPFAASNPKNILPTNFPALHG